MFINSFIKSIKHKTKSRKSLKSGSVSPANQLKDTNTYETLKLSKDQFGNRSSNSPSMNDNSDIMEEFVIVDYKEYEPYTIEEWQAIIAKANTIIVDQHRLYVSLQRDIPKSLRREIWLYLAGVEDLKAENAKKGITYESLLTQDCPDLFNIQKDTPRTFSSHEFFKNQQTDDRFKHLENILRAYAVFDPEVGYSQGMNFLAGFLVYYMYSEEAVKEGLVDTQNFESDAFWIFVHILQAQDWRSVYKDNTPKLMELLNRLEARIKEELPGLYTIFKGYELIPACFSQCFLSLLFYNSPMKFAKRVLDMFLLIGDDIILDLIIRMLTLCQKDILAKTEVEELYPFLRNQLVEFTFQKYEKEFANLVTEQSVIQIIEYD